MTKRQSLSTDEQGFLSAWLLTFIGVWFLVMFAVLLTIGYGIYTKGKATYQWADAAAVYATMNAIDRDITGQYIANEYWAREMFVKSFEEMTETTFSGSQFTPDSGSIYPGPIELCKFQPVTEGQVLPNGTRAGDLGFLVQLRVTLWAANVPFVGTFETVKVPMTIFAVRQGHRV